VLFKAPPKQEMHVQELKSLRVFMGRRQIIAIIYQYVIHKVNLFVK